jgi:hypothetical protein
MSAGMRVIPNVRLQSLRAPVALATLARRMPNRTWVCVEVLAPFGPAGCRPVALPAELIKTEKTERMAFIDSCCGHPLP